MKTQEIFKKTKPYNNPYQGSYKRVLAVCTAGLLRSPTLARILTCDYGYNSRSCGSNPRAALIFINENLVQWADKIYFLDLDNYTETLYNFNTMSEEFLTNLKEKSHVLGVPDIYEYMQPELVEVLKGKLENEDRSC